MIRSIASSRWFDFGSWYMLIPAIPGARGTVPDSGSRSRRKRTKFTGREEVEIAPNW